MTSGIRQTSSQPSKDNKRRIDIVLTITCEVLDDHNGRVYKNDDWAAPWPRVRYCAISSCPMAYLRCLRRHYGQWADYHLYSLEHFQIQLVAHHRPLLAALSSCGVCMKEFQISTNYKNAACVLMNLSSGCP